MRRGAVEKARLRWVRAYLHARDAKVSNLCSAIPVKHDVAGLEVSVHHAGVEVCQALRHVMRQLQAHMPSHAGVLQQANSLDHGDSAVMQTSLAHHGLHELTQFL